jgi:hypothetical protein
MLNPKDRYWVLVADSGQARLLEIQRLFISHQAPTRRPIHR